MRLGYTVLVVDDDDTVLQVTVHLLTFVGYNVLAASDAAAALAHIDEVPDISLVFTDARLRATSGCDLAQHIRRVRPELPVVLTTGDPTFCATRACDCCVTCSLPIIFKPYTYTDLHGTFSSLLCPPPACAD